MQTNPLHLTAKIQQTHLIEMQQTKTQQIKTILNQNIVIKKKPSLQETSVLPEFPFFLAKNLFPYKKINLLLHILIIKEKE